MDKATRRDIKQWEKRAAEAAGLKEKAANLLKKAGDIEVAQKAAFDAVILRTAYATGLDALPLCVIMAGFAALSEASKAKQEQPSGTDKSPVVSTSGQGSKDIEATIDLIVHIGRNTSPKRFEVLNKYLTWNGRNGEWSGKVTRTVLAIFEGQFEPRQLVYSTYDLENVEGGSSITSPHVPDNVAHSVRDQTLVPSQPREAIGDVRQVETARSNELAADQAAMDALVRGELATTQDVTNSELDDEAAALRPGSTAAGNYSLQGPPETIGPVKSDISINAIADEQRSALSRPTAVNRLPRSSFAALRRHGQG